MTDLIILQKSCFTNCCNLENDHEQRSEDNTEPDTHPALKVRISQLHIEEQQYTVLEKS